MTRPAMAPLTGLTRRLQWTYKAPGLPQSPYTLTGPFAWLLLAAVTVPWAIGVITLITATLRVLGRQPARQDTRGKHHRWSTASTHRRTDPRTGRMSRTLRRRRTP
jgi:hypothetical protein